VTHQPNNVSAAGVQCQECGMSCEPNEHHPLAACLIYKQTHNSDSVCTNFAAVAEHALATASGLAEIEHD
jgi:hypothetical protein